MVLDFTQPRMLDLRVLCLECSLGLGGTSLP